ncbi:MAG: hypothetical protein KHZ94_02590 [Anaerostipes sp.]|uniref:aminomethyltransferase beta-barrel domain-containing protein n=1 Tax=Anaerostipes sp. TaxID=1872530 RepID=UPI000EBEE19D|nr:hypothetical protein [Anaerostipes sp.]RGC80905.1 hypothetical protein DW241_10170 [Hungatella hathewayi]
MMSLARRCRFGILKCCFEEKVRAAPPGQAIVFYHGEYVLGGGTIIRNKEASGL